MLVSQILLHNILDIWIYFFFAGHSCAVTAKRVYSHKSDMIAVVTLEHHHMLQGSDVPVHMLLILTIN